MSLKIDTLSLNSWRNFKDLSLELAPGLTVLVGPNAAGKTNTIEALQYLTAATSFRKPSPSELIFEGQDSALIKAHLFGDGRTLDIEMQIKESSRRYFINKKAVKSGSFTGNLYSVLFNPDDLLLIKGSASKRRDELDNFGIQLHNSYKKIYSTYTHSIEQRNHLLKEGITGTLLDSWDESVALGAATLLQYRLRMFEKLKTYLIQVYSEISPTECLDCFYISSLPYIKDIYLPSGELLTDIEKEALATYIQDCFYKNRQEDVRRGQTLIGPHRDDINFTINGRDARKFASQGQQRSIVLAWKMAEVKLCEQLFNSCPLLLLDDVMSELDESRRACITNFINTGIQTVITTTNLGYFTNDDLQVAKVVEYEREL